MASELYATSDVARDILQNSEYFTSAGRAINEYVWNSIDYCKPNSRVSVRISVKKGNVAVRAHKVERFNGIVVEETANGAGMSEGDLNRFFTMHGETLARKEGRRVRGRYGTGKSAAFGVGKSLIVDTTKGGRRNVVRLDIEDLRPGLHQVPVKRLLTNQATSSPDGTTVIIDRLKLRRIKIESVRKYLRRSVGRHLGNHDITVEGQRLVYSVPEFEREWIKMPEVAGSGEFAGCRLYLRLAKAPLDPEEGGVAILANGYVYETYSLERFSTTSWVTRLFGEIDVPQLEGPQAIPAFDNTRSELNRDNELVTHLLAWVDREARAVFAELDSEVRARMDQETAEKLQKTATELEDLLNADFAKVIEELESTPVFGGSGKSLEGVRSGSSGGTILKADPDGETQFTEQEGGDATLIRPVQLEPGSGSKDKDQTSPGDIVEGKEGGGGEGATSTHRRRDRTLPRGGFKIRYVNLTREAPRAQLVREKLEIRINLDFPELSIFGGNVTDLRFKALSAEFAITEYAIATVQYKVEGGSVSVENTATSALIEFRRDLDRLGRALEGLLTAWGASPSALPVSTL